MAKKALIVYGTRYGATQSTSEEIAKVLQGEGLEVNVVNAKKERVRDISPYDLKTENFESLFLNLHEESFIIPEKKDREKTIWERM